MSDKIKEQFETLKAEFIKVQTERDSWVKELTFKADFWYAETQTMKTENEALKLRVAEFDSDLKKSEFTCIKLDMEKNEIAADRDSLQSECNRLKDQERNFQKSIIGNRIFES